MVTRRVSEDFYEVLANASGYQYTQLQKLIYPVFGNDWERCSAYLDSQSGVAWLAGCRFN